MSPPYRLSHRGQASASSSSRPGGRTVVTGPAALQGLARQFARGGTQFRELSLARTAHWLLGLPRAAAVAPGSSPASADGGDKAWLATLDSAEGPVTTVRPPGQLDDEALDWPRSLSRYGGDQAAWRPEQLPARRRRASRVAGPGRGGKT